MSYKQRRDQIYKIPNLLLAALIFVFLIGLFLSLVNILYPNPISSAVLKDFPNNFQNFSNLIIGALIASIIGLFSSVAIIDLKEEKNRDNLILSFYYEFKEINKKIQQIPSDDLAKCATWLQIEKSPIYYDSGLFLVFRKEMSSLEQPLLEKMLPIYSKIIFIEQQWKNLHLEKPEIDQNTPDIIRELKNEMNVFFPLLEKEKEKIVCAQ